MVSDSSRGNGLSGMVILDTRKCFFAERVIKELELAAQGGGESLSVQVVKNV